MNGHLDFWIDAYLDGELPVGMLAQVEKHLQTCNACQRLLQQRQDLSALLQQVPAAEPLKSEAQFIEALNARRSKASAQYPSLSAKFREWLADDRFMYLAWSTGSLGIMLASLYFRTVVWLENLLSLIPGMHHTVLNQLTVTPPLPQLVLPETIASFMGLSGWFDLLDLNWLSILVLLALLAGLNCAWLAVWMLLNRADSIGAHAS